MIAISKEAVCRALAKENPWWGNPGWQPAQTRFRRAYFAPFCDLALTLNRRRSVILMGPRQVGKTVMLKQLIHTVLRDSDPVFAPDRILFASLDTPAYSGMPLDQLMEIFEEETGCGDDEPRLVIFDEIQYLDDWERHLKVLTDRLPNTKFVASGSAAAALRRTSKESGAGRFTDFILPPLLFVEFIEFDHGTGALSLEEARDPGNIGQLNRRFIDYLNYGGYPEAVINPDIREDYQVAVGREIIDKVLLCDLPSLYGIQDTQELNRLMSMIAWNTGQEMSLDVLSRNSGVTKPTISRYLEYLEAAMLIRRVRRVDNNGKTFKRERQFKIHLTNPSLRAALFAPVSEEDTDQIGHLAETALFSQILLSSVSGHMHYARWKSGRKFLEVDMVLLDSLRRDVVSAQEIKWSDRIVDHPEELSGLIAIGMENPKTAGRLTATTRTESELKKHRGVEIDFVPCALDCLILGTVALEPELNINDLIDAKRGSS